MPQTVESVRPEAMARVDQHLQVFSFMTEAEVIALVGKFLVGHHQVKLCMG